ncbi:hypothetical protein OQA88_2455 [Cercophora sp. LCS_1]
MDHQQSQAPPGFYQVPLEKPIPQYSPYPQQTPLPQQASPVPGYTAPQPPSRGPTILNVKRSIALAVLGFTLILFILVIGLGAGLGSAQSRLSDATSKLHVVEQLLSQLSTSSAPPAPTPTTPTSTPTPTPVKSDVQCPKVNGTSYETRSSGTTKKFRYLCGFDYGEGEATDIGNTKTLSLEKCADACAKKTGCTGAGWGVISGDKGPEHVCWMKNNLTTPHVAPAAWGFALMISGNGTEAVVEDDRAE